MIDIDIIVTPLIRDEIPALLDMLDNMPRPRESKTKIIFSIDSEWSEDEKLAISARIKSNEKIREYISPYFISCRIPEEQSVYLRKLDANYSLKKLPYGCKSGPNIQFFRTINHLIEHKSGKAAILLETDAIPLIDNWLDIIEQELQTYNESDFYVAGTIYKGDSKLPDNIKNHINGNAVINFTAPNFKYFFGQWEKLLLNAVPKNPTIAYDYLFEWVINSDFRDAILNKEILFLYKTKFIKFRKILNLAGPIENSDKYTLLLDDVIKKIHNNKSVVLHLKKALPYIENIKRKVSKNTIITHIEKNIIIYDYKWQYPAITEQHAAFKVKEFLNSDSKITCYFGFPWATLIDEIDNKSGGDELLKTLSELKSLLMKFERVVTVCQHIRMLNHIALFKKIGITDIFWSHQTINCNNKEINIYPFPLYPVNKPSSQQHTLKKQEYLFSFVGAKANGVYLTSTRNKIIELLSSAKNGKIISRDSWHYNKIVYDNQIRKKSKEKSNLIETNNTKEFINILKSSKFSLSPSGSGPNSIRLWESIGYGSIPVILADTYLPPGNQELWEEAVVFCKETEEDIKALPERLEEMAKDPALIERKLHALKQLWMLYGPDCFVYDILKLFLKHDAQPLISAINFSSDIHTLIEHGANEKLIILAMTSRILSDPINFKSQLTNNTEFEHQFRKLLKKLDNNHLLIKSCKVKEIAL